MEESSEIDRLRRGIEYLIYYLKRSEADFYCEYRHDGPADMAFQRLGNIRSDAQAILNPEEHAKWYENTSRLIDRYFSKKDELLAEIDQRIKEEDEECRKKRFR